MHHGPEIALPVARVRQAREPPFSAAYAVEALSVSLPASGSAWPTCSP
jgi:hypothetical protein